MSSSSTTSTISPPRSNTGMASEKSPTQQRNDILDRYPLPDHWLPPSQSTHIGCLRQMCFMLLCLFAYGKSGLENTWIATKLAEEGDETAFIECQRRTSEQQNNVLVLAGLLLATSSVFITTTAPDTSLMDFTRRGPYLCICGAFGLLVGGIVVSSICIQVVNRITPSHTENVLYGNPLHVYCTLICLAYSPAIISVATLLLGFAVLSAVWCADNLAFKLACIIILGLPISIGGLFTIASMPIVPKKKLKQSANSAA